MSENKLPDDIQKAYDRALLINSVLQPMVDEMEDEEDESAEEEDEQVKETEEFTKVEFDFVDEDDFELPVLSRRQFIIDFLEDHYGQVEIDKNRGENFLICWYQREDPGKVAAGDAMFYAFVGKSYLVIEVPCSLVDEVTPDDFLDFVSVWGRGRCGQANVLKNVVSTMLVEDHPDFALAMIDQLVEAARVYEAEVSGLEVPSPLFPQRSGDESL